MGIFEFLKKKSQRPKPVQQDANFPQMLTAKLLYAEPPVFDKQAIITELRRYFQRVDSPDSEGPMLFFFPDSKVTFTDGEVAAQCTIFFPDKDKAGIEIPEEAFQQNWHWEEAAEAVAACQYEVLVSDFMTRQLDYKSRLELFIPFLIAVIKATRPQAIYSVGAQKLIAPHDLVDSWEDENRRTLHGLVNVRLFYVSNGAEGDTVMDTVGMYLLGLPDFQIRFADLDATAVGELLWGYAYYTYDEGDVIANESTIQGVKPGSKWKCERQESVVSPDRLALTIEPN